MKKPKLLFLGLDGAMPSYIKHEAAKGNLPGFARLIGESVFFEDCMPVFPTITPTCWNSIYTGAVPKVHGGVCEIMHKKGTNPWECVTSYHGSNIKAERFWEAASKKGYKTLLLGASSSVPSKGENLTCYGMCGLSQSPDVMPQFSYVSGRPQQFLHINTGVDKAVLDVYGTKVNGAFFNKTDVILPQSKVIGENTFEFPALKETKFYNPDEIEDYSWVVITHPDGVQVGASPETAAASKKIGVGEWTDVITRELMTDNNRTCLFHFRARLDEMDATAGKYVVYITATKNLLKDVLQESDADEIMHLAEVNNVYGGLEGKGPYFNEDKYFDIHGFHLKWKEMVLSHCIENHDYDIIFDYIGYIDSTNHYFRPGYEGYRGPEQQEQAERILLRCYQQIDKHLSWLLDNVADEDTNICVVSDHGAIGYQQYMDQFNILEKAGLAKYIGRDHEEIPTREMVDWSQTKAYSVGSCHIFVNLEGREPCGIVKPEDYHKVVGEIIDALHQYARDVDGSPAIAFAVPGDQAGFFGQGGECGGDVIYGLRGSATGGYYGDVHAMQIPSAHNATGGNIRSLCIMRGKSFKKGCSLERPIDLTDIAPTMCYATGMPIPKDATGGIIFQAFREEE